MKLYELQNQIADLSRRRDWYYKKCQEAEERGGYDTRREQEILARICQRLSCLKDRKHAHLNSLKGKV